MTQASPAIIIVTIVGMVAMVYAFICRVRADRVARVAVERVRELRPDIWQGLVAENERRQYLAVAAAVASIAVLLIGARYWGWTF